MKSKDEIFEKICSFIEEVSLGNIHANHIKPGDKIIVDLGLDSLDYAAVMLQLEQWTGSKIDENKVNWAEVQSVAQLSKLFGG